MIQFWGGYNKMYSKNEHWGYKLAQISDYLPQ